MPRTRSCGALVQLCSALVLCFGPGVVGAQLLPDDTVILAEEGQPPFGPPQPDGKFGSALAVGDFNGDGLDDFAASRISGEGRVYVFHGSAAGPQFAETLSQFNVGEMGAALATCDFNADGYDDLAIGAPTTSVRGASETDGLVLIYLGAPNGLVAIQSIDQSDLGLIPNTGDEFGATLATGDFDADGNCDLAVQSPGENYSSRGIFTQDSGLVSIVYGSQSGQLDTQSPLHIDQFAFGVEPRSNERLGSSLLTLPKPPNILFGAEDDLLIGSPDWNSPDHSALGRAVLIRFDGRSVESSVLLDPTGLLVDGVSYQNSRFGEALGSGRFFGQEHLVISMPGVPNGPGEGAVLLIPRESSTDANTWGVLQQESAGFTSKFNEDFGRSVAVSDFDGDGFDDLAVGTPNDLEFAGARGVTTYGSVLVFYSGADSTMGRFQLLLESDLGNPQESSNFGEVVVSADLFGRGAPGLVTSAPRRDGVAPTRGDAQNSNGTVYVVPSRSKARDVALVVRTGVPFVGDARDVVALSSPASNAVGGPGFRGEFEDGETFVALDGTIVFRDSDSVEPLLSSGIGRGFVRAGSESRAHIDEVSARGIAGPVDVLVTNGGITTTEGDALAPPGSGDFVGRISSLVATSDERVYFAGTDGSERRILRTAPGISPPIERVLEPGDPYDGLSVFEIEQFGVSPDGSRLTFTGIVGDIAQAFILGVDGQRITAGNSLLGDDPTSYFGGPVINDSGRFAFYAALQPSGARVYAGQAGEAELTVDSKFVPPSSSLQPVVVSLGPSGTVLHLWSDLVNRQAGRPLDSRGLEPPPDAEEILFESCASRLGSSRSVLRTGDHLRIDDSLVADTEVKRIYFPEGAPGIAATPDDVVFLHVALQRGAEEFDAIIELPLSGSLFCDGFELGDSSLWTTSVP